jgi:hypothetical protein
MAGDIEWVEPFHAGDGWHPLFGLDLPSNPMQPFAKGSSQCLRLIICLCCVANSFDISEYAIEARRI